MDKGKMFILSIVILVAVLFLGGVLYIIANFVFRDPFNASYSAPIIKYSRIENTNIKFEKIDDTSDINYNFKI